MIRKLRHIFFLVIVFSVTICSVNIRISYAVLAEKPSEEISKKGFNLYFVRHAETKANVTGHYIEAYQRIFTEKGEDQISRLTDMLKTRKFDFICVSPKWRALNTILPYLKERNKTAEIWPELEECCYQREKDVEPEAKFLEGAKVVLNDEQKDYFRFRAPELDYFYKDGNYVDGLMRVQKACALLLDRFGQSGKSVLVVGHSLAGGRMIEILLGMEPEGHYFPHNAHITHLKQQPDGKFELIEYNLAPSRRALIRK